MYEVDQYTVSLLHFDNGIKDETGKVWTANGGAATSTTNSKIGGSSLYLDGNGQYIQTQSSNDFDFGTGDFTIDWWEYRYPVKMGTIFSADIVPVCPAMRLGYLSENGYSLFGYISATGTSFDVADMKSMGNASFNTWNHFAIVRQGSKFYIFQNGALKSTWTATASIPVFNAPTIGFAKNSSYFKGYIDEFRISKIARWTSDFDPAPQAPSGNGLLRVTMNDSSEREYRLPTSEIEKFIKWYDRTVGTGNTCYAFDDIVDLSKEYLSFEKIISFKVIPLKD